MRRPVVAVTGPDRGGTFAWVATSSRLRKAGARPVRVRPSEPHHGLDPDALVLGGGADIDPRRYGGRLAEAPSERLSRVERREVRDRLWRRLFRRLSIKPFKRTLAVGARPVDPARDALEVAHLERALERGIPVLGICRGAQLLNIEKGGTLHQDLKGSELNPTSRYGIRAKDPITVVPESRLAEVLGRTRLLVNSLHNQAVDRPGKGLEIVARDRDGVVEGIEIPDAPYVIGVQWHPEYLPTRREDRRLFERLVEHARDGRENKPIRSDAEDMQRARRGRRPARSARVPEASPSFSRVALTPSTLFSSLSSRRTR
ncbi:MAG: gamma-glutamyl-gamma-aminobutyrate hydrolase family protein [Euryarchaeota archaeon]|nr:gamma-glutamyl-gamma-aminobutyrate hydrolase family protein [Euryarchaeota archaeon]